MPCAITWRTILSGCFNNTYKILDQYEQALRTNANAFAVGPLVVLMALKNKNVNDEDLKQIKLDLARELTKKKSGPVQTYQDHGVKFIAKTTGLTTEEMESK